jgi:hypothetical protein
MRFDRPHTCLNTALSGADAAILRPEAAPPRRETREEGRRAARAAEGGRVLMAAVPGVWPCFFQGVRACGWAAHGSPSRSRERRDDQGGLSLRCCGDARHAVQKKRDFSSREHTSVGGWALGGGKQCDEVHLRGRNWAGTSGMGRREGDRGRRECRAENGERANEGQSPLHSNLQRKSESDLRSEVPLSRL